MCPNHFEPWRGARSPRWARPRLPQDDWCGSGDTLVTPYADVDEVLRDLVESVEAILGDCLVAVYLEGSVAAGGFDARRSDIDVVVVTTDHLPGELISRLGRMHAEIAARPTPWATELEVTYAPKRRLRRFDPDEVGGWPNLERGRPLAIWKPDFDWTVRLDGLRRHAIVMRGPAPPRWLIL